MKSWMRCDQRRLGEESSVSVLTGGGAHHWGFFPGDIYAAQGGGSACLTRAHDKTAVSRDEDSSFAQTCVSREKFYHRALRREPTVCQAKWRAAAGGSDSA